MTWHLWSQHNKQAQQTFDIDIWGWNVRNWSFIPSALTGSVPRSHRYAVRSLIRAPKCNSGRFDDLYPVWSERWNHDFQKPQHTDCGYICRCVCLCQPKAWVRLSKLQLIGECQTFRHHTFFRICWNIMQVFSLSCYWSVVFYIDALWFMLEMWIYFSYCESSIKMWQQVIQKKKKERWWLCETTLYWMKLNLRLMIWPYCSVWSLFIV